MIATLALYTAENTPLQVKRKSPSCGDGQEAITDKVTSYAIGYGDMALQVSIAKADYKDQQSLVAYLGHGHTALLAWLEGATDQEITALLVVLQNVPLASNVYIFLNKHGLKETLVRLGLASEPSPLQVEVFLYGKAVNNVGYKPASFEEQAKRKAKAAKLKKTANALGELLGNK